MQAKIINQRARHPRAHLVDPPPRGYLHLAAAVQPPVGPPFPRTGTRKAALLDRLKALARQAEDESAVEKATVYRAVVMPPAGGYAKQNGIRQARYDVAVLVETSSPDTSDEVGKSDTYQAMREAITNAASDVYEMSARCVKSLGDVDKSRPGLFLFNYFAAEDPAVALELWDYLAGWYQAETGLDNSTVLQSDNPTDYAFVSHARWDYGVPRLLLLQLTKPSFRSYIQANLLVNRTASMPLLYHLV
jgi:hypothetical protein